MCTDGGGSSSERKGGRQLQEHRRGRENSVAGVTDLQEPHQFIFRKCYFAVVETRTAWTLQRAGLPAVQAGATGEAWGPLWGARGTEHGAGRGGSVLVQLGLWSGRRAREQMHGAGLGGSGYRTRCRGRGSTPPALPRWGGGTHDSGGGPTRHCIMGVARAPAEGKSDPGVRSDMTHRGRQHPQGVWTRLSALESAVRGDCTYSLVAAELGKLRHDAAWSPAVY